MSKKKSTTKKTTTDADHPTVLPMTKGGPAKKKGKPQPPADPNVTASETADTGPALPPAETPPANVAGGKAKGNAKET